MYLIFKPVVCMITVLSLCHPSCKICSAHLKLIFLPVNTVKALVIEHPQDAKMVSVIAAGRLREFQNTEFVWDLRKTGFCEGVHKQS